MTSALFTDVRSSAVISECGLYRYRLTRKWDDSLWSACFIMLNPSTADATQDDPTIRKCVGFARAWGCGGIVVVNLFAYRATDPRELVRVNSRLVNRVCAVGPENDRHIREAVERCDPVVAAWGVHGVTMRRDQYVNRLLAETGVRMTCLGTTKDGHPKHPLYMSYATELVRFSL